MKKIIIVTLLVFTLVSGSINLGVYAQNGFMFDTDVEIGINNVILKLSPVGNIGDSVNGSVYFVEYNDDFNELISINILPLSINAQSNENDFKFSFEFNGKKSNNYRIFVFDNNLRPLTAKTNVNVDFTDIIAKKNVTIQAGSSLNDLNVTNVSDGDDNTYWVSNPVFTAVVVDLGKAFSIDEIEVFVTEEVKSLAPEGHFVTELSNDKLSWKEVWSKGNPAIGSNVQPVMQSERYRYVRFLSMGGTKFGFSEIKIKTADTVVNTKNVASNGSMELLLGATQIDGEQFENLVDEDYNTSWRGESGSAIAIDLGAGYTIDSVCTKVLKYPGIAGHFRVGLANSADINQTTWIDIPDDGDNWIINPVDGWFTLYTNNTEKYRYVILMCMGGSDGGMMFGEIEINTTDNYTLTNVAKNASVRLGAGSTQEGYPVENLTDSNVATGWQTEANGYTYVSVNLGNAYKLETIKLYVPEGFTEDHFVVKLSNTDDGDAGTEICSQGNPPAGWYTINVTDENQYQYIKVLSMGNRMGFGEIEAYTTDKISVRNVAENASVRLGAGSTQEGYPVENLTDGSVTTGWQTEANGYTYVSVDLGALYKLDTIKLYIPQGFAEDHFVVKLSDTDDGDTGTEICSQGNPPAGWYTINVTDENQYQYIKVLSMGNRMGFGEIEAYTTDKISVRNVAENASVRLGAGSTQEGYPVENLTDGSVTTGWQTEANGYTYVSVDLGALYKLDTIKLYIPQGFAEDHFVVKLSDTDDGDTGTEICSQGNPPAGWYTINVTDENQYQYIKVLSMGNRMGFGEIQAIIKE